MRSNAILNGESEISTEDLEVTQRMIKKILASSSTEPESRRESKFLTLEIASIFMQSSKLNVRVKGMTHFEGLCEDINQGKSMDLAYGPMSEWVNEHKMIE